MGAERNLMSARAPRRICEHHVPVGHIDAIRTWRFRAQMRRAVQPERFAAFGMGALVHPPVSISDRSRVRIGDAAYVLANASIRLGPGGQVVIGPRTYLGRDLTIIALDRVEIGADVMGSDRLVFADTEPDPTLPGAPVARQQLAQPRAVRVGDGVFLGTGAVVLPGVTIGERAFIGAGAVVTADVPANAVVVGNPARVVRWFDREAGIWRDGQPA